MSSQEVHLEPQQPECFVSAKLYERYLWLGHCVTWNPQHFRQDELDFHQDETTADRALEEMLEFPEKLLIQQMGRIIKRAASESYIRQLRSMTPGQQYGLQVYLSGEVSRQGMQYAHQDGYISQDPYLAAVESPFKDSRLIAGALRYQNQRSGQMSKALLNYASLDKLLPGYLPAISVK